MRILHAALPHRDDYLPAALEEAGHVVETMRDVADLLLAAGAGDYDALLLEAPTPGALPLRRIARAGGRAALVLVVDEAAAADRASALRHGADACFVRPVHFMELVARLAALVRLAPHAEPGPEALVLDPATRTARRDGRSLALSMREYALLDYLAGRTGEVVGAGQIFEHVWGEAGELGQDRIRTAVARLRAKLEAAFGDPMIGSVRGHGYHLGAKMKLSSSG